MKIRKIRKHNTNEFIKDLKSVSEVVVWVSKTTSYLKVRKSEVAELAEAGPVYYYLTDKIFKVRRTSMVLH